MAQAALARFPQSYNTPSRRSLSSAIGDARCNKTYPEVSANATAYKCRLRNASKELVYQRLPFATFSGELKASSRPLASHFLSKLTREIGAEYDNFPPIYPVMR
jgi:hypothetical protein